MKTIPVELTMNELLIIYDEIDRRCREYEIAGLQDLPNTPGFKIRDKITAAIIRLKEENRGEVLRGEK